MSKLSGSREAKYVSQSSLEASKRSLVSSRYMNATASSRAAAISKPSSIQQESSSSTLRAPKGDYSTTSALSKHSANAVSTTKRATQSTNVSASRAQSSRTYTDERSGPGLTAAVDLDVASQLYSWLYMRHSLAESSHNAETTSEAQFAAREREVDAEEVALMDDRIRLQIEREIQLIDELSHEHICRVAPPLVCQFVESQGKCQEAISNAVRARSINRRDWNVLDIRVQLQTLEQFAMESTILRMSLAELASAAGVASKTDSLLASALHDLVHLLDARLENLGLSKDLLLSYPIPLQKLVKSGPVTRTRYVNATFSSMETGKGFVTLSVQGDGIHILELSTMHASVSHTLGPSTFFTVPAVTRFEGSGTSFCYAVIQSAPDGIDPKERGRTVWRWCDRQLAHPAEHPQPKLSIVFPHLVACIWAPPALESHVVAVSPSGQIMLADRDLKLVSSSPAPGVDDILLRCWLFRPETCSFLPRRGDLLDGVMILRFVSHFDQLKLRIALARKMGELTELLELDMGTHKHIAEISCDPSGFISIMTHIGEWKSFWLCRDTSPVVATPLADPIRLSGISLNPPSGNESRGLNGLSLLSVGSSYVLLAGIVGGSSPQIALLLWDLQYSVVLASQFIAVPPTVAYTPESLPSLELVPSSKTQALLTVSPSQIGSRGIDKKKSANLRSTVLVIPLEVPSVSTIALAMGKARDTQRWLRTPDLSKNLHQDDSRSQMMLAVRSALEQGRPQVAEDAFFTWVKEETTRLEKVRKQEILVNNDSIGAGISGGDGPGEVHKHSNDNSKRKKAPTKPILSHHFVSSVLSIVLSPNPSADSLYPSKIVAYLMNRKAVGNAMVEGGLISALRRHGDWESIYSSLKNVPDIPEVDLVVLLADTVKSQRRDHQSQENSMQVDAQAEPPPFARYLAAFVAYTTSPSTLRLALKHHLSDMRDMERVLEVLEGWIARWCGRALALTSNVNIPDDESQLLRKKNITPSQNVGMPSLENIMSFLQCMLDAHFIALLQDPACHKVVEKLGEHFRGQLTSIQELDRLRGPLESFIRAQAKEASVRKQEGGDWRKKRKSTRQAVELAVGLYQIEELVI